MSVGNIVIEVLKLLQVDSRDSNEKIRLKPESQRCLRVGDCVTGLRKINCEDFLPVDFAQPAQT